MRALYQGYCRACRGTVNVGDSIVHQMENVNSHWDCDDPRGELTPTQRKQRAQEPTHEQLRSEQTAEQRALDDAEYAAEMRLVRHDNATRSARNTRPKRSSRGNCATPRTNLN